MISFIFGVIIGLFVAWILGSLKRDFYDEYED
jgi:NhaP-type Na+/H+ or K+/H+ antiporter